MPEHLKGETREEWMDRCIPDLIKNEDKTKEQAAGQCGGMYDSWKKEYAQLLTKFEPPESGDAPEGVNNILDSVYSSCRQEWIDGHPQDKENQANKESCAQQAWGAVKNAGWVKTKHGWQKSSKMSKEEPETYDIDNVEIAAIGIWDASTGKIMITENDFDEMIKAYKELTEKGESNIPLKLGHDDNQKLLQKDGYPSAGWVMNLRKAGDKMLSDFKAIPKVIYKIIMGKGYTSVSPEIIKNYKDTNNNKTYKRVLSAVALLGKEHKAMTTLKDLVSVYSQDNNARTETLVFSMESPVVEEFKKEANMEEVERLTKERDESKAEVEKYKTEAEVTATKNEKLSNDLNEVNEKLEQIKLSSHKEKVDTFIEKYKNERKILPSQEDAYRAILDNVAKDEPIKFSIDGEEKEGDAFYIVKSIVESNPNLVELDEFSQVRNEDGTPKAKTKEADGTPMTETEEAAKVDKFMKENKIEDGLEGYRRARAEGVI